mmetsp:Transcript_22729/g.70618  ORF Transcript_22729/g.70618 Transcript_22729/m.70618 type:complete len:203 (+) Transcript_22729:611-1219(+)
MSCTITSVASSFAAGRKVVPTARPQAAPAARGAQVVRAGWLPKNNKDPEGREIMWEEQQRIIRERKSGKGGMSEKRAKARAAVSKQMADERKGRPPARVGKRLRAPHTRGRRGPMQSVAARLQHVHVGEQLQGPRMPREEVKSLFPLFTPPSQASARSSIPSRSRSTLRSSRKSRPVLLFPSPRSGFRRWMVASASTCGCHT